MKLNDIHTYLIATCIVIITILRLFNVYFIKQILVYYDPHWEYHVCRDVELGIPCLLLPEARQTAADISSPCVC